MKLEKFDYQIGNKKTKREFVALGVLCLFLVITVVLYRTFASFTASSSYNIIAGRVAPFNEERKAIITKDISASEKDSVNCILYNDGSLTISGKGNPKDFTDIDLIGEITEDYIASNVEFSLEEQNFITANEKIMKSLFDVVIRPWSFEVKEERINEFLEKTFVIVDPNDEDATPVVDTDSVNMAKQILAKVKDSDFYIEKIEITEDVKSLGTNTFALLAATNESETRDKEVYLFFNNSVDYAGNFNMPLTFNVINLDASLDLIKEHAVSDLTATSIVIGDNVTKIPNDMFAYYNDDNSDLVIPNQVKSIGINAFYSYNGKSITLPNQLDELESYAFALYNGSDIAIPGSLTNYKENVFRDFEGKISINACDSEELSLFAPKAEFNSLLSNCE